MIIRQIEVKNYINHTQKVMEVTEKQHEELLRKAAEQRQPVVIKIIKERNL